MIRFWHERVSSVLTFWSSHDGAFSSTRSTDDLSVFLPNLGGGVWTRHTHLPEFLIHCSEAELRPRAARLLGQHAESGLQQQISLRRPDASELRWCCGVKIKQTPCPKSQGGRSQTEGLVYPAADSFSDSCHVTAFTCWQEILLKNKQKKKK